MSVGFDRIEDLDHALPPDVFRREPVPYVAAFLAGKARRAYRRRGGARSTTLPDFFIGAHAAVGEFALLTRGRAPVPDVLPDGSADRSGRLIRAGCAPATLITNGSLKPRQDLPWKGRLT